MARIAVGGLIGGLMLAITVGSALHPPRPIGEPATASAAAPEAPTMVPPRCRAITMPDSGCDAAWDARRRHFFGEDRTR